MQLHASGAHAYRTFHNSFNGTNTVLRPGESREGEGRKKTSGAHAVPPATGVSYVNAWEEIDPLSRVEMKKMCWQKDDSIVSVLYSLPL